jgi:hypothetical protein
MQTNLFGPRNNTNFQNNVYTALAKIKKEDGFVLYHHKLVHEYVLKNPECRGMLIMHDLGSGKTKLGVHLCNSLINKTGWSTIFISTKTLHSNFRETLTKYYKTDRELKTRFATADAIAADINDKYKFVTLNASNLVDQVVAAVSGVKKEPLSKKISLDNHILIMDEAHNFANSVVSGGKNATQLYDLIMNSRNVKVIFLTATPCVNSPYEIIVYMNILAGYHYHDGHKFTLFDESYDSFAKYFIAYKDGFPYMVNRNKISDRIFGLVSYYKFSGELAGKMPTRLRMQILRVKMSPQQFAEYYYFREKEAKQVRFHAQKAARFSSSMEISSTYRVRSRQVGNFYFPADAVEQIQEGTYIKFIFDIEKIPAESWKNPQFLRIHSPKIYELLKMASLHSRPGILDAFRPKKEEIEQLIKKYTEENKEYLKSIGETQFKFGVGQGFIYSQFLEFGIRPLIKTLAAHGFKQIHNADDAQKYKGLGEKHGSFAIITGEVPDDERATIREIYNGKNSPLDYVIFSSTGIEGISLFRSRFAMILEPFWNALRINQIIARGIRLNGHEDLPKSERNLMPYIFLADYPEGDLDELKKEAEKHYHNDKVDLPDKEKSGGDFDLYEEKIDISGATYETDEDEKYENVDVDGGKDKDKKVDDKKIEVDKDKKVDDKKIEVDKDKKIEVDKDKKVEVDKDKKVDGKKTNKTKKAEKDKKSKKSKIERTDYENPTDIEIYNIAMKKQILINSLYQVLKISSIDCMMNSSDCRICNPTNQQLWSYDFDTDMKLDSVCRSIVEEKIKAETIVIDEEEYAYNVINGKTIKIYKYITSAKAYKELQPYDLNYNEILQEIEKRLKQKK